MQRVVITGMGVVCPLGTNTQEFWQNLAAGKSGIVTISRFDATNYPAKVAGEVRHFDPLTHLEPKAVQRNPRAVHFAIPATREALAQSRLDMSRESAERVGVIGANMLEYHFVGQDWMRLMNHGPRRVDPLLFAKAGPSIVSVQIGMLLGATGPNVSVNSLCASGGEVIATAADQIRAGYADVMVAAASDASLSELGIAVLGIVGALSRETNPDKASRPFDLNRNGFVYGEGCGVMILESLEHARRRDAPILAEVAGACRNFDAYDTTAPQAETEAAAMKSALRYAGVRPEEVSYINAHGTSTKLNDASETKALKIAFGEHAYRLPVSSFKSMFGHMVTAAGIVESIGTVMAMEHGLIPPTIHYETPDPACDLDYVPNIARTADINIALKSSFGLGGQNCCLVLRKFKE